MAAVPRTYTYDVRTMKSLSVTRVRRSTAVRAVAYPPVSSSIPFDSESRHLNDWEPGSWRNREALQQPEYPNEDDLVNTVKEIEGLPPLVFAGECRLLQSRVAAAANGEAFLLFGAALRHLYFLIVVAVLYESRSHSTVFFWEYSDIERISGSRVRPEVSWLSRLPNRCTVPRLLFLVLKFARGQEYSGNIQCTVDSLARYAWRCAG